jgi:hypothetical protein
MLPMIAILGVNRDFPRKAFGLCSVVLSWLDLPTRGFRHSGNSFCDRSVSHFLLAKAPTTTRTNLHVKFVV